MKILDVEEMKDPKLGKCYVVKTSLSNPSPNSINRIIYYVILKPVFDRYKTRLYHQYEDLTKNGRWEKLFNFAFNPRYDTKREFIRQISSVQFDVYETPTKSTIHVKRKPMVGFDQRPFQFFQILNKKGVSV